MRDFKGLQVWRKAHALTLNVYRVTRFRSRREHAALVNQARRAAMSVAANIAEGCARATQRDFVKFLNISYASSAELEYHLILARDLRLLNAGDFRSLAEQIEEVQRMLAGLQKRVHGAASGSATPKPPSAVADGS